MNCHNRTFALLFVEDSALIINEYVLSFVVIIAFLRIFVILPKFKPAHYQNKKGSVTYNGIFLP